MREALDDTKIPNPWTSGANFALSGHHSCFLFARSRVHLSARKLIIVAEIFRAFPHFLKAFYMRSSQLPNLSSTLKLVITEQTCSHVSFRTSTAKVPAEPTG